MTNYEWLMKNETLLKSVLEKGLAVREGQCALCSDIYCGDCDSAFNNCQDKRQEWLEAEHETLYKKGDILILEDKDIAIVTREDDVNSAIVSHNIGCAERGEGWRVHFDLIERKIGNIYDE